MQRSMWLGVCCAVLVTGELAHARNARKVDVAEKLSSRLFEEPCDLYRGDLGAEIGAICSDGFGPAFAAVAVTAPFPPPISITGYYYNVFTAGSKATALTFSVWAGGDVPGALLGSQAGLDVGAGYHKVVISPPVTVSSDQFFFGMTQPQDDVWPLPWGIDMSSGGGGTKSFAKYPGCGANVWLTMTSIGIAGDWTIAVCVSSPVPVELESWGKIKSTWHY